MSYQNPRAFHLRNYYLACSMSAYSSVNSARLSVAARSHATASSGLTRISAQAAKPVPDSATLPVSLQTRASLSSQLCEFLEANVTLDEYGFTDKVCRKCGSRLSLEELIALCVPLAGKEVDVASVKIDEGAMICLNCYAE